MNLLAEILGFLSDSFAINVGTFSQRWMITLAHFLWQGLVIGLLVAMASRFMQRGLANARYALLLVATLSFPVCILLTFLLTDVEQQVAAAPIVGETTALSFPVVEQSEMVSDSQPFELGSVTNSAENQIASFDVKQRFPIAEVVVSAYLIGVGYFLIRLVALVWGGQRLCRAARTIDDESLLTRVRELSHGLGLKFVPLVSWCDRVAVPTVIGIVRPTILLPPALISGLDPKQLETILIHELAHIRRYDLWLNLLQRVIESLLFFHPVVWYVSRQLSNEREACCDDLVVASGHDSMDYVGALLRVAELNCVGSDVPATMLAATGQSTSQLELRIKRLMAEREPSRIRLSRGGAILFFIFLMSTLLCPLVLAAIANPDEPQQNSFNGQENQIASSPEQPPLTESDITAAELITQLKERDSKFERCFITMRREWPSQVHPQYERAMAEWQASKSRSAEDLRKKRKRIKLEDLSNLKFHTPYTVLRETAVLMTINQLAFRIENRDIKTTYTETSSGRTKVDPGTYDYVLTQAADGVCKYSRNWEEIDLPYGFLKAIKPGYQYDRFSFESDFQYYNFSCGFGIGNRIVSIEKVKRDGDLIIADGCVVQTFPSHGGRRLADGKTPSRTYVGRISFTKDLVVRDANLKLHYAKQDDGSVQDANVDRKSRAKFRVRIETKGTQNFAGLPAMPVSGYSRLEIQYEDGKWYPYNNTGCRVTITDAAAGTDLPARMRTMMNNAVEKPKPDDKETSEKTPT